MKWSRLPESVDVIISHIIGACSILWFVLFINNSPNNTPDMSYYCHWEKEKAKLSPCWPPLYFNLHQNPQWNLSRGLDRHVKRFVLVYILFQSILSCVYALFHGVCFGHFFSYSLIGWVTSAVSMKNSLNTLQVRPAFLHVPITLWQMYHFQIGCFISQNYCFSYSLGLSMKSDIEIALA